MTDESDIQYKDGNGDVDVEISESNTVWTYNKQSPETSPIYPNQRIKMLIF